MAETHSISSNGFLILQYRTRKHLESGAETEGDFIKDERCLFLYLRRKICCLLDEGWRAVVMMMARWVRGRTRRRRAEEIQKVRTEEEDGQTQQQNLNAIHQISERERERERTRGWALQLSDYSSTQTKEEVEPSGLGRVRSNNIVPKSKQPLRSLEVHGAMGSKKG